MGQAIRATLIAWLGLAPLACSSAPPPSAPRPAAAATRVEVAVTVDDLPVHGPLVPGEDRVAIVERIISALRRHHVPPVHGFVNGKKVDDDPRTEEVLRRWVAGGNHLGNHTYSHPSLVQANVADYLADLDRGEAILEKVEPGGPRRFFRYPFLLEGDTKEKRAAVRAHLRERGYTVAEVTIDADDWAYNAPFVRCAGKPDAAALAGLRADYVKGHVEELGRMRELTRRLTGREIRHVLLLHAGAADAEVLEELLTAYEQEGVAWIDLPRALADPFYAIDPDLPSRAGPAFPYLVAQTRGVPGPPPVFARGLEERLDRTCR